MLGSPTHKNQKQPNGQVSPLVLWLEGTHKVELSQKLPTQHGSKVLAVCVCVLCVREHIHMHTLTSVGVRQSVVSGQ